MDDSSSLFSGAVECKISPLVVMGVLDHYMRRNQGQERVIGTLLGSNDDGVLHITQCFPVPHTEADTVGIDMDFHKTMMALVRQAHPGEIILGWYTSGAAISEHSILIHDFFGREIQRPPVHVCVGVDAARGVQLAAYMSQSVALKDRLLGSHFAPVPLTVVAESSDRAVLQAALKGRAQAGGGLEASLERLEQGLEALLAHAKAKDRQAPVGRALLAALAAAPGRRLLDDAVYDAAAQDTLAAVYLTKLTKAQVELCAQLNGLFIQKKETPKA